ncbi:glutamine synthetase family protein [Mycobacterium sp. 21AC1]|uniref:glutamine synthetase family protein n=1 Tax=[Mycobacterium] appelbergii TaxID=2939269 RepID=UPI002938E2DB|nr:glutamine synthetase family protein [Mycobacterium sp. 21AC1]MDV3128957.1 glutamine synthetase family protein [Mycobacterium sp. 21AC1]
MVSDGDIGVVELVLVDMQGRLQGKRVNARHFLDVTRRGGCEAQTYLLATDVEMNTVDGYDLASWSTGYGNLVMRPDLTSMRRLPWHPRSVLAFTDVFDSTGAAVTVSPRQLLRTQLDRLNDCGWNALIGTELEFQLFADTYRQAWQDGYRSLRPVSDYGSDYGLLDTRGTGSFLTSLADGLEAAGIDIEGVLSEAGPGQQEIVLGVNPALTAVDNHALAKFATKQIAAAAGYSATFMAKLGDYEGNSCHVHFSLRDHDNAPVMADDGQHGFSDVMRGFLAGQLAYLPELTLMFAPNINSYKRFVDGSYAPTTICWGHDNRTCALRVVGSGRSLRFEHRLPGADANMYLVVSAIIAAGLRGLKEGLTLPDPLAGNAYAAELPRVPRTLSEALTAFKASDVAAQAFGEDVVRHYTRTAEIELEQFNRSVTDWEKFRGFERL